MSRDPSPWNQPGWLEAAESRLDLELKAVGRSRTGPIQTFRKWGRSCIQHAPTDRGKVWIKHGYGLPPGESEVLSRLVERWSDRLPGLVAHWSGTIVMLPMPGAELAEDAPLEQWTDAARGLAMLQAGERDRVDAWLALGLRDRRPPAFRQAAEALLDSPDVQAMPADLLQSFTRLLPRFVDRYATAYAKDAPTTLVPQDSGCCNIHMGPDGPIFFDWADVVVGHPTFSCDRLLDQVPQERQAAVIDAFLEPLSLSLESFRAMRRSNVLHEVLRYHDELGYLSATDPARASLANSVRSQIRVLVEFELAPEYTVALNLLGESGASAISLLSISSATVY